VYLRTRSLPTVGKERVRKYTEYHLIAMEKAAVPEFDPIIHDTRDAYEGLFGNIKERDKLESDRKEATKKVNLEMANFKANALEIEPLVSYKLGKLGKYEDFFPNKLGEIHDLTQENAETVMQRFVNASTNNAGLLGENFTERFTKIQSDYMEAYKLQKGLISAIKINIPDWATKCVSLLDLLFRNMLLITAHYFQSPDSMLAFFDESILEVRRHKPQDGEIAPVLTELEPGSSKTLAITYTSTDLVLLSNVSKEAAISYFTSNTADALPPAELDELKPGEEVDLDGAKLLKYIIVINKDTLHKAEVEVSVG